MALLTAVLTLLLFGACSRQAVQETAESVSSAADAEQITPEISSVRTVLAGEGGAASPAPAGLTTLDGVLYGTDVFHRTV